MVIYGRLGVMHKIQNGRRSAMAPALSERVRPCVMMVVVGSGDACGVCQLQIVRATHDG